MSSHQKCKIWDGGLLKSSCCLECFDLPPTGIGASANLMIHDILQLIFISKKAGLSYLPFATLNTMTILHMNVNILSFWSWTKQIFNEEKQPQHCYLNTIMNHKTIWFQNFNPAKLLRKKFFSTDPRFTKTLTIMCTNYSFHTLAFVSLIHLDTITTPFRSCSFPWNSLPCQK